MAVTSGFFNSINGDRRYDALQMAELFDGLINDGVYETLYERFRVTPNSNGLAVQVDTGRGWFAHTWVRNDGLKVLTLSESEILFNRIDAVVVEVNHNNSVRKSDIKVVKGTPSASPVRPTMKKEGNIYQYPLAYVQVNQGATAITQGNITNMVGSSECPFVTGIISVMDIDMLIEQWEAQWDSTYREYEKDWADWYKTHITQFNYDFQNWFNELKALLDGNTAANLTKEILELKRRLKALVVDHILTDTIDDSNDDPILDSSGREIEGFFLLNTGGSGDCCCDTIDISSISDAQIDSTFTR